jgi:predicted  nucleic acid-binding Zn-ribbon protein
MKDTLTKLLELQAIDSEIIELQQSVSRIPEALQKEADNYEKAVGELSTERQLHEAMEKECRDKEVDVSSAQDTIKELQSKQAQVKRNQEYQALSHEIKQAEDKRDRTQAALEQQRETISTTEARLAEKESTVESRKGELLGHAHEAKKEVEQLAHEIKQRRSARDKLIKAIDPEVLGLYEKLLKTRAPRVVVKANNNVCAGCHINLPAQVVADIMKLDRLVVCENCARILYIAEEETDAVS